MARISTSVYAREMTAPLGASSLTLPSNAKKPVDGSRIRDPFHRLGLFRRKRDAMRHEQSDFNSQESAWGSNPRRFLLDKCRVWCSEGLHQKE